ncbi:translation initiation factor IF-2-like [Panicum virgatum]|uniref:translation initiation factor IF-2-like n=1 Tax=Panicum virgatum TaxID=38727 RepID=UPI0019D61DD0|nr:translation initiation factor IF-2-like [Panicum virgatum]
MPGAIQKLPPSVTRAPRNARAAASLAREIQGCSSGTSAPLAHRSSSAPVRGPSPSAAASPLHPVRCGQARPRRTAAAERVDKEGRDGGGAVAGLHGPGRRGREARTRALLQAAGEGASRAEQGGGARAPPRQVRAAEQLAREGRAPPAAARPRRCSSARGSPAHSAPARGELRPPCTREAPPVPGRPSAPSAARCSALAPPPGSSSRSPLPLRLGAAGLAPSRHATSRQPRGPAALPLYLAARCREAAHDGCRSPSRGLAERWQGREKGREGGRERGRGGRESGEGGGVKKEKIIMTRRLHP